jgi:hypothetical protein
MRTIATMARTSDSPASLAARYATVIYIIAALMVVSPPLDIMLSMQQYVVSSPRWRFGAVGLLTGSMLLPMLGLVLASFTASLVGHRWVHRVVLVLAALMVLTNFAFMGSFALDSIEIRRQVNSNVVGRFDVTVVKTLLLQVVQIVTIALIARSTWRSSRALTAERRGERAPDLIAGLASR